MKFRTYPISTHTDQSAGPRLRFVLEYLVLVASPLWAGGHGAHGGPAVRGEVGAWAQQCQVQSLADHLLPLHHFLSGAA